MSRPVACKHGIVLDECSYCSPSPIDPCPHGVQPGTHCPRCFLDNEDKLDREAWFDVPADLCSHGRQIDGDCYQCEYDEMRVLGRRLPVQLVRGGQERSARSTRDSAAAVAFFLVLAIVGIALAIVLRN